MRRLTNSRGRPDRPAPAAFAGLSATDPVLCVLTGRGRPVQLGARRLPEGSPGACAAAVGCLRRTLCVARRAAAGRARHLRAPHDGARHGVRGSALAWREVGSATQWRPWAQIFSVCWQASRVLRDAVECDTFLVARQYMSLQCSKRACRRVEGGWGGLGESS